MINSSADSIAVNYRGQAEYLWSNVHWHQADVQTETERIQTWSLSAAVYTKHTHAHIALLLSGYLQVFYSKIPWLFKSRNNNFPDLIKTI